MKLLVVDKTTESQAELAKRIGGLDPKEVDTLDLSVHLAHEDDGLKRVKDIDVLAIGPEFGDRAPIFARKVREIRPDVEILIFVTPEQYALGAFRMAHTARVRKVFSTEVSDLDLLQEFVNIYEGFCQSGKRHKGKTICIVHPKGGVGATSIAAALGEISGNAGRKTLLWDLDIESRDLCRALTAGGSQSEKVTEWIDGSSEITRESLRTALFSLDKNVSLLMPPHLMAAGMDMVGHPDGISVVRRVLELAKVSHANIIIDTAGRLGPASGALLLSADVILVVIEDSVLGLSAVVPFIEYLDTLLPVNDGLRFVRSGTELTREEMEEELKILGYLPTRAWSLPKIPFDANANKWAGQGKTLFSVGSKSTQAALEQIASEIGLIPLPSSEQMDSEHKIIKFFPKLGLGRAGNLA